MQYNRVFGDQNGLCRSPATVYASARTSLYEAVKDCDAMFVCSWTITTITQRTPSQYVDNSHEWYVVWISCEGLCAVNLI